MCPWDKRMTETQCFLYNQYKIYWLGGLFPSYIFTLSRFIINSTPNIPYESNQLCVSMQARYGGTHL